MLEIVFVVGLFAILSLLVFGLLQEGLRRSRALTQEIQLQQQAQALLNHLQHDLLRSNLDGIRVQERTTAIVPLEKLAENGTGLWSSHLLLYHWQDGNLGRHDISPEEQDLGDLALGRTSLPKLSPSSLASVLNSLQVPGRLWRGVKEWELQLHPEENHGVSFRVRVLLQSPGLTKNVTLDSVFW